MGRNRNKKGGGGGSKAKQTKVVDHQPTSPSIHQPGTSGTNKGKQPNPKPEDNTAPAETNQPPLPPAGNPGDPGDGPIQEVPLNAQPIDRSPCCDMMRSILLLILHCFWIMSNMILIHLFFLNQFDNSVDTCAESYICSFAMLHAKHDFYLVCMFVFHLIFKFAYARELSGWFHWEDWAFALIHLFVFRKFFLYVFAFPQPNVAKTFFALLDYMVGTHTELIVPNYPNGVAM